MTDIPYNTPLPNFQAIQNNEPGVLSRVYGITAGCRFDSLVVCCTEIRVLSRMCIVISMQGVVAHDRRLLEDLVRVPSLPPPRKYFLPSPPPHRYRCIPFWTRLSHAKSHASCCSSNCPFSGPSTSSTMLADEPSTSHAHTEQTKLEREMTLVPHFEESSTRRLAFPSRGMRRRRERSRAVRWLCQRHRYLRHPRAHEPVGARLVDVSD
ncbi:hypothetical protein EI94DRAFT_641853 [Lactarius quietus]|nr:hypothetical protein EI94DRAFT_641853 [Lactarius quietus]